MTHPEPERPSPRICIPLEQGGPVITLDIGIPFRRLLLRWWYSNPHPHGVDHGVQSQAEVKVISRPTVSQPVYHDIKALSGPRDKIFFHFNDNYSQTFAVYLIVGRPP
jgi:hypothetical protein